LRLVYSKTQNQEEKLLFGVSVSKKHFKNAVDRNYYKRVLRECYRLNKHLILDHLDTSYAVLFFYQSKERLTYQEIHEKTVVLFEKWIQKIQETDEIN
jgi:ribonuclease P protein component